MFLHTDTQELHTTLYHTFRSISETAHYSIRKRTVVYTYSYGSMMLFTYIQKGNETISYFLQFSSIFLVRVFQFFKSARRIHIVSRIDTHLLHYRSCHISYRRIKMHIGYQRSRMPLCPQPFTYRLQILRFACTLRSKTHQFTTCSDYSLSLSNTSVCIHCRCS